MDSVSLVGALLAGIVSFVSPCVLPIVPGYLSFISGVNVARYRSEAPPGELARKVGASSAAFVAGFSTVFVTLGAAATAAGALLHQHKRALAVVGGAAVIVLGLHMTGLFRLRVLLFEKRAEVRPQAPSLGAAYLVGLAFAFGWTPCIGPILGTILLYAAQQETVAQGVALLGAYSVGLGVPFLLSGLAVNALFAALTRFGRALGIVEVASGVLLVAAGVLLATNQLTRLAGYFARLFPSLAAVG